MIINLLLPLLASSAVLARFNVTFPARECTTHNDHTANGQPVHPGCTGNTPPDLGTGRAIRTIKGPYSTPEPTTYARTGGIERRLVRTIRPDEELATRTIENPAPTTATTTKTKLKTRIQTTHALAPVKKRSLLPVEGVPSYTIKPKPTIKTRLEARETPAIVPIGKRLIGPGGDKSTETPRPTPVTKTKTRNRTMHTFVSIEERSFRPIEDVPTFTVNPKPTKTKTKKGGETSTLDSIEESTN